jgi:hypothetical protein
LVFHTERENMNTYRPELFENGMLRKIFGTEREVERFA